MIDTEIKLGKIVHVEFGLCGYQEAMMGIEFTFEGRDGWGVGDSKAYWSPVHIGVTEHTKWTEEDRNKSFVDIVRFIDKILDDAKVRFVSQLKGKPVEVIFEGNILKSWRILTEVI